jgi:hypothetical protein
MTNDQLDEVNLQLAQQKQELAHAEKISEVCLVCVCVCLCLSPPLWEAEAVVGKMWRVVKASAASAAWSLNRLEPMCNTQPPAFGVSRK